MHALHFAQNLRHAGPSTTTTTCERSPAPILSPPTNTLQVADDDEHSEHEQRPRQRRRRDEPEQEPEDSEAPGTDEDQDQDQDMDGMHRDESEQTQMVKKLVRYALACEYSRTPIRREGIRDKGNGTLVRLREYGHS